MEDHSKTQLVSNSHVKTEGRVVIENKAFENFLRSKGQFSTLEFIWACRGMKAMTTDDTQSNINLVKCIYNKYISNGSLTQILSNKTLLGIVEQMIRISCSQSLASIDFIHFFNKAEEEVHTHLDEIFYHEFLWNEEFHGISNAANEKHTMSVSENPTEFVAYTTRKPQDFSKELTVKLEALELEEDGEGASKRARLRDFLSQDCIDCSRDEKRVQEQFAQTLAAAIETKLLRMKEFENNNFDQEDEKIGHHKTRQMQERFSSETDSKNKSVLRRTENRRKRQKRAALITGCYGLRDCDICFGDGKDDDMSRSLVSSSTINSYYQ